MSTLRNSIPSRSYRERPQPLSRSRSHPLLEKRKDYRLRAADHKVKQARLKLLREKAAARNPDEFSFKMMSSSASRAGKGKKRDVDNTGGAGEDDLEGRVRREVEMGKGLRVETVKLLKTQDAGFLRVMRSRVRREREKLEGLLRGVGSKKDEGVVEGLGKGEAQESSGKHMVYVDGEEEQAGFCGLRENTEEMVQEDGREWNKKEVRKVRDKKREESKNAAIRKVLFEKQRAKLEALQTQEEELGKAERELELQRARMQGNSAGVNKSGVKFKAKERKR